MRRRGLPRYVHGTVIAHTKTGTSLRGVLVGDYTDCIVLAHAEHLGAGENPVSLGGEQIIPRENLDFVQTVTT